MSHSRIPSPARSQGAITPRRQKPRGTRSVGSPARSTDSGRLTAVLQFKENNRGSFALSPAPSRRSVLNDDTYIDEPRRRSWWKKLGENSRDVMEVLTDNKILETNEAVEEYIDIEVLSQEKKNYTMDLPDSSDSESISSIVIPQRKLFTQKDLLAQNKFGKLVGKRESLAKLHKSNVADKTVNVAPKNLFNQNNRPRTKPVFPAGLLNISPNKTANKTKEMLAPEVKSQARNLFGNRGGTKRKNMFADFIVSESEDEIPEIQPKVFGFQKKVDPGPEASRGKRDHSPTSSITTDIELDEWQHLPSSTMVENQIEDMLTARTPAKRARLSKLTDIIESNVGPAENDKESEEEQELKYDDEDDQSEDSNGRKEKVQNKEHQTKENLEGDHILQLEDNNQLETNDIENVMEVEMDELGQDVNKNESQLKLQNTSKGKNKTVNQSKVQDTSQNKSRRNNVSLNKSKGVTEEEETMNKNNSLSKTQNTSRRSVRNMSKRQSVVQDASKNKVSDVSQNKQIDTYRDEVDHENQMEVVTEDGIVKEKSRTNKDKSKIEVKDHVNPDVASQSEKPSENLNIAHVPDNDIDIQRGNEIVLNGAEIEKENKETRFNMSGKEAQQETELATVEKDDTENENAVESDQEDNNEESNEEEIEEPMEESEVEPEESEEELNYDESEEEKENEEEEQQENETTATENEAEANNDSEVELEMDENKKESNAEAQNESVINEAVDDEVENEDNEDDSENVVLDENDIEMPEENNAEALDEINAEEANESNTKAHEKSNVHDKSDVQARNKSNMEVDDEGDAEAHDESDLQKQNESDAEAENGNDEQAHDVSNMEVHDENNALDRSAQENDEGNADVNDESNAEVNDKSEAEAHDESNVEVNNESDEEANDESEAEALNQSYVESEAEAREESHVETNDESEAEAHEESHVEANDESEAEAHDENEAAHDESNEEAQDQESEEENESVEHHYESDSENAVQNDSNNDHDESENEIQDSNEQEISLNAETPNVTHDTTGRFRKKNKSEVDSPEAILHDKTNQIESFVAQGRNTSIRKTTMLKNLNIRPSLAPPRESTGLSDGTRNSGAEGSGWDSHRTTRKTLRQTFGRDFTPRKSLRALVMEKSAKQQPALNDVTSVTTKFPQANSTEIPDASMVPDEEMEVESNHEVSERTRQTTLEMYLQKIKKQNFERKLKMEEAVRNSLKAPTRDHLNPFKVPSKPSFSVRKTNTKQGQTKAKSKPKSVIPLDELPEEVREDMKYKPPRRFQPSNAAWITKRLYKFLESKLESKYDYKARIRAEKLVESIYQFAKELRRLDVAPAPAVDDLKHEMARLDVVKTHFDFYQFFHDFMPREIRVKVVPDVVNKIGMPRHGVFSDILRGNNVQG